jgi:hypothetical protein
VDWETRKIGKKNFFIIYNGLQHIFRMRRAKLMYLRHSEPLTP